MPRKTSPKEPAESKTTKATKTAKLTKATKNSPEKIKTPGTRAPRRSASAQSEETVMFDTASICLQQLQELLAKQENSYGADHAKVADTLATMADLLTQKQEFDRAEGFYLRALEVRSKFFGRDSSVVAETVQDIAAINFRNSNWSQSEKMYSWCLDIAVRKSGLHHKRGQEILERLREVLSAQGKDPVQADRFAAGIANSTMNDLIEAFPWDAYRETGENALSQQDYKEADRHFTIMRDVALALSPESVHCAQAFDLLAQSHYRQGKIDDALRLQKRVLSKYEQVLGIWHPETAHSLLRLAKYQLALGDISQALAQAKKSAQILEATCSEDNPRLLSANRLIKEITAAKINEAVVVEMPVVETVIVAELVPESSQPDVLPAPEMVPPPSGDQHWPDVFEKMDANVYEFLWTKYMSSGKRALETKNHVEAERMFIVAIEKAERFGKQDHRLWDSMCQLALALAATGKLYKAATIYQEVLSMCEAIHGADSIETVPYLTHIAESYSQQSELTKAKSCYERILRVYQAANAPEYQRYGYQERILTINRELDAS